MILDEIRTLQKRQDEHENHLLKKTEEMQGNKIRFKKSFVSVGFGTHFGKPFKTEVKQVDYFYFTLM